MSNGKNNNDERPSEGEGEREEGRSRSRRSTRYLGELSALEPERLKHARVPTSSHHLVDIGIVQSLKRCTVRLFIQAAEYLDLWRFP